MNTPDFKAFADEMIGVAFEGSSIDGAAIQEIATRLGLLKETTATEPCGEHCACAEVTSFPATCYRKTYQDYAMVPVEPTDRQIFEVCRESGYGDLKTQDPECWEILKRDYRVAVAAAQEPTA